MIFFLSKCHKILQQLSIVSTLLMLQCLVLYLKKFNLRGLAFKTKALQTNTSSNSWNLKSCPCFLGSCTRDYVDYANVCTVKAKTSKQRLSNAMCIAYFEFVILMGTEDSIKNIWPLCMNVKDTTSALPPLGNDPKETILHYYWTGDDPGERVRVYNHCTFISKILTPVASHHRS